jgi:wobble nucleotide-excising tRNase
VFRDFAWPTDLHGFGQFNVIYGWNGCGKTTLSSLLSYVEKRVALSEGELELEFDDSLKVVGATLGSTTVPQVRVFNRDFINATLHSSGAGIAPIYFLGEGNVEKHGRVEKLKKDLKSAITDLTSATTNNDVAAKKLDEFCRDKAKFIKELLTSANSPSYNNYDKRRFRVAVQGMSAEDASTALLTDGEKTRLRSQKNAQPKRHIEMVESPSVDLVALRKELDALDCRSVVAQTLNELTSEPDVALWVRRGLDLHSAEHASSTCRFCNQRFERDRRSTLEAHFNDAFASFQDELNTFLDSLTRAKQRLTSLLVPETSRFYDHLVSDAADACNAIKRTAEAELQTLDVFISRIAAKRDNPFAPVTGSASNGPAPPSISDVSSRLNAIVHTHNKTTDDFTSSVDDACARLERCYVAEALDEYNTLARAVRTATNKLEEVHGQPAVITSEIEELERQILEHRRPADELTAELCAYLGRDELRFEVKDAGYSLTRGGSPVTHLSEGERTAISFLYFLKSLQDRTFDVTNGVVVIDDPVSSLDANALFSAFGYMKERTKQCGQLFILTHSFPFFRLVKNWFHHLPKQRKSNVELRPARFFMLRSVRHVDGSRTSQLGPLDRLLQEHESEYQYLFKRVYSEAHRTDVDSLEQHYGLPNVARRLLEAFLAFRFPEMSGDLGPRLDRVSFDNAKKTRILRLLNTYSHADAVTDPEHDLSLLAETQPVLVDVLEMMKAVDKEHYEGLEKLLTAPTPS